jgi:hypothetical protein
MIYRQAVSPSVSAESPAAAHGGPPRGVCSVSGDFGGSRFYPSPTGWFYLRESRNSIDELEVMNAKSLLRRLRRHCKRYAPDLRRAGADLRQTLSVSNFAFRYFPLLRRLIIVVLPALVGALGARDDAEETVFFVGDSGSEE